ncbi:hypothetical protein [Sphingomonas aerolata]|uniref:hypothetical protein n=1 Tax=Sphingomonas aerolata TaxID=185951 RepID=UPI00208E5CA3|nr:hypothetical protein [Sphingomonas aerolata]USQ99538.1 hypothetical protein NEF64_14095 [Sphingomonas aerolata]
MNTIAALLLAFLALLSRVPTITLDLGSLADWVSGLGSLAAVAVALNGFRIVEGHRASDRANLEAARAEAATAADKAVAYELAAAIGNMSNNLIVLRNHVRNESRTVEVALGGVVRARYQTLTPLVGLSEEGNISLPTGTTELLIKADAAPFWNDVMLLSNSNRAITSIMKQYNMLHEAYILTLPPPTSFVGAMGHITGEPDELRKVEAHMVRLHSVVISLADQIVRTDELQRSVAEQMGPIMTRYFKGRFLHFREEEPNTPPRKENPQPPEGD